VLRGGSWRFKVEYCRSANRFFYSPRYAVNMFGLRVAAGLD